MAEVTLYPGEVVPFTHDGAPLPVVGDPPQWADNDDATYATVSNDSLSHVSDRALLDPYTFPGLPVSVVYHVRASSVAAQPALVSTGLFSLDFAVNMLGTETAFWLQPTSTLQWFVSDSVAIPDPGAFATKSQVGEITNLLSQDPTGEFSEDTRATIYESHIVVTYQDGTVHPTRLYPGEGLRMSSATRIYPPPRTGRVYGGYR